MQILLEKSDFSRKLAWGSLSMCFLLTTSAATPAGAQSGTGELLKYLNPKQKQADLNESQDRSIKKKSFKLKDSTDTSAVTNKELGMFALVDNRQINDLPLLEQLLSQPEVNGLSVLLTWHQLEPVEGQYNWAIIDKLLDTAGKYNKCVILRISTGGTDMSQESDTPKWVFDNNVKSLPYTAADGKQHLLPIFWDVNYLANWSNFVKDLGARYDKNPFLHSIGITGGGVAGGTAIIPALSGDAAGVAETDRITGVLKKDHSMSQRQLIEHWKYAADLFPQAFPTARLNFDIDPPTLDRSGQDALDQISDYLVYRYGQRVYLTRQNIVDDKHGFDQYRLITKFRPDTLTGYQLSPTFSASDLPTLTKWALDDGISYAEIPTSLLLSKDASASGALQHLAAHIGYQILSQKANISPQIKSGSPIKASFTFINLGDASPAAPVRNLEKDVAGSYKVQLEVADSSGRPIVLSLRTPSTPTNHWAAGKSVSFDDEFKLPKLPAGQYTVWMSLIDADSKRKINLLDGINKPQQPAAQSVISLGKIKIVETTGELGSQPNTQETH